MIRGSPPSGRHRGPCEFPARWCRWATAYEATPKIPIETSSRRQHAEERARARPPSFPSRCPAHLLSHRPESINRRGCNAPHLVANRRDNRRWMPRRAGTSIALDAIGLLRDHHERHRALSLRTPASLTSATTPMMPICLATGSSLGKYRLAQASLTMKTLRVRRRSRRRQTSVPQRAGSPSFRRTPGRRPRSPRTRPAGASGLAAASCLGSGCGA